MTADEGAPEAGRAAAATPAVTAVVGGGTMGAGIAEVLTVAGARVTVLESAPDRVAAVRERLERRMRRALEQGRLAADPLADGRLAVTDAVDALAGAVLVVEAVPEDHALKSAVLERIEAVVAADALIATNTSALSVTRLAQALRRPDRFLGMHFFNPVPQSALVEIVTAAATAPGTVDAARAWVERLGKEAIVVRDSPGFASSRLGIALAMEAIRMLEAGVASADDIDRAMVLGYRHPMGPLRLTDLVGLDVRLAIAENLTEKLGDRFRPPQLLRDMVAAGRLGQKTGEGFHRW